MEGSLFFTFDGIDGTGKSTQIDLTVSWLKSLHRTVVSCRDPGTTPLGEALRKIVLESVETKIDPRSETLIYMAARAQLVEEIIRPALERGETVVSDRYLLANVVYQGYGFSLPPAELWALGKFATGGLSPTKTIVFDLEVSDAMQRICRSADRMEQRDFDYFERLRAGFLEEAKRQPDTIAVVDASQSIAAIQAEIRQILTPLICSA